MDIVWSFFPIAKKRITPFFYLMFLELETNTTVELLDTIDINRVNLGTIVGQESGQRTTNNFGSVNDSNHSSVQAVSVRQDSVIDSDILHDLDQSQGCARNNTLLGLGLVQETNVMVHVVNVLVVKTFHILAHVDDVLEVLILLRHDKARQRGACKWIRVCHQINSDPLVTDILFT